MYTTANSHNKETRNNLLVLLLLILISCGFVILYFALVNFNIITSFIIAYFNILRFCNSLFLQVIISNPFTICNS